LRVIKKSDQVYQILKKPCLKAGLFLFGGKMILTVKSKARTQLIDITPEIQKALRPTL